MPLCNCRKSCSNDKALDQHRQATGHLSCGNCKRGLEVLAPNNCKSIYDRKRPTSPSDCLLCDRHFCCKGALDEHNDELHLFHCGRCSTGYQSKARYLHQRVTGHCACKICDRPFSSKPFLERHARTEHEWICYTCNKLFTHDEHLRTHQASTGHCYCRECDGFFGTDVDLRTHNHKYHASHFHCCDCDRDFFSEDALTQHLADKLHHLIEREPPSWPCSQCNREFGSEDALGQHRASTAHSPLSDIPCLGDHGRQGSCKRRFASPSALLQHLESGACSSGCEKLNDAVEANDIDCLVSNANAALLASLEDVEVLSEAVSSTSAVTPATNSDAGVPLNNSGAEYGGPNQAPILTPRSTHSSLSLGWTVPSGLTCPRCPSRRPFNSEVALWQHLMSPVHLPPRFHCPLALLESSDGKDGDDCKGQRSFSTLSGLASHIESGACHGGKFMLWIATKYLEDQLEAMGHGEVRLLKES